MADRNVCSACGGAVFAFGGSQGQHPWRIRMRSAQVAPLYESVPPEKYGGTQRVISYLTEELVRLGHQVTLLASGDSRTSAELIPVCSPGRWRDETVKDTLTHHVRQLELVARNADQFEVVHFHGDPF